MTVLSKDSVQFLSVCAESAGQRLDNYLIRELKGVPKSHIQRIIRSGEVRLNKKRCKGTDRIAANDQIRLPPIRVASSHTSEPTLAIPAQEFAIVYEDDVLLVINKPSGIAVHGGSGISFGVIEQLRRARPKARYLELVHRLDKDTSGLLMIAKKRSALVKLHESIRQNHPHKVYLALAVGIWPEKVRQVKCPLLKYTGAQGEKMVRIASNPQEGQRAHTQFRVLQHYAGDRLHAVGIKALTLMEATLKTGRTHQIRVHMQSQLCPIAGDERYGDYQINRRLHKIGLKRMFLHAAELTLAHPVSGDILQLTAPLPDELQQFLHHLSVVSGQSSQQS
ncbi:RNA pseudouridine synthase [Snodgrassella communis]|uniref:RluA family pseudouridine synthase n=1 Tax=Snodgrassella communis TaxID=2946699 RepID=UPI00055C56B5|nr:RluA family pseudouridine synthase [Snodgrassella communis]PIT11197.1 RNA pseudouridine synthase [Snodgrassella communis]PIT27516.1 RNA pseudouridine synthase [Snodgrassella communis]PIT30429.1 RNA pseudouridine synthase [Snodgrassella communis]PIT34915.1 RNA pseudouridine synthase [Snodgrassella communis]